MNRKTEFPASAPGCLTAMRLQLAVVAALLGMGTAAFPALGQESKKAQPTPPGTGASRGVERVPMADEGPVDYRARWAVIIGIDKYPGGKSGLEPLLFAANDARAVRDMLRDDYGYDKEHILALIDEEAPGKVTRQSLIEAFQRWLPGRPIAKNDSVLVFFAGHGLIEGSTNQGYLAAADSNATQLPGTCLAVESIKKWLEDLLCQHKLLILDSCYSGSMFLDKPAPPAVALNGGSGPDRARGDSGPGAPGQRGSGMAPVGDNLSYYLRQPAFYGMSAGRFTPVADGLGEERHSVFTSALLKVLRERANSLRADHAFTFRQLAAEVESRVASALRSRQIPDWGRLGPGDGDFVFLEKVRRLTPREESSRRAYAQAINDAQRAFEERDLARLVKALDASRPDEGRKDLRGFEWYYLWGLSHAALKSLSVGAADDEAEVLAVSPDGRTVAASSGGRDRGTLTLWDLEQRREKQTIPTPEGRAVAAAFSPDGRTVAASSGSGRDRGTLTLWDLEQGREKQIIPTSEGRADAVAFSPDATMLAWGDDRGYRCNVTLWDLARNRVRFTRPQNHSSYVLVLAFSPDSRYLAAGSPKQKPSFGELKVWETATGNEVHAFGGVRRATFSPGGRFLATIHSDQEVEAYDASTWKRIFPRALNDRVNAFDAAFSPDGALLATGGSDRKVHLWNLAEDRQSSSDAVHAEPVVALAFSPDGRLLATGSRDKTIKVWDALSLRELFTILGHEKAPSRLAFSPDSSRLISLAADHTVKVWDAGCDPVGLKLEGHPAGIAEVVFSPDGLACASVCFPQVKAPRNRMQEARLFYEAEVDVWNTASGRHLARLHTPTDDYSSRGLVVALDLDGRSLATAIHGRTVTKSMIQVLELPSGQPRRTMDGGLGEISALAFSPDGTRLAALTGVGGKTDLRVWPLGAEGPPVESRGVMGEPLCLAFDPGGTRLAVGVVRPGDGASPASGAVGVFDAASGGRIAEFGDHTDGVWAVTFSRDGQTVISASLDRRVKVWDAGTARLRAVLRGEVPTGAVSPNGPRLAYAGFARDLAKSIRMAVSPDGPRLAYAAPGNTIKLWDPAIGQDVCTLPGHAAPVHCLCFNPDGTVLATGEANGTVRLWATARGEPAGR